MQKDSLGNRMKKYESVLDSILIPNSYTIVRLDGKAFHNYTKKLNRPYDEALVFDMDKAARFVLDNIEDARFCYVQSDEVSILLEDVYNEKEKVIWFNGRIQKILSLCTSYMTSSFNHQRILRLYYFNTQTYLDDDHSGDFMKELEMMKQANFDARIFQLPNLDEVFNYFYWRWLDNDRNSIQRYGQYHFSHKQLHKKSCGDIIHMLLTEKDIDYTKDCPLNIKYGRFFFKKGWSEMYINLKNDKETLHTILKGL